MSGILITGGSGAIVLDGSRIKIIHPINPFTVPLV